MSIAWMIPALILGQDEPQPSLDAPAPKELFLEGSKAKLEGAVYVEDVDCVTSWQNAGSRASWICTPSASGRFAVVATLVPGNGPARYTVTVGERSFTGAITGRCNPGWMLYEDEVLGTVELAEGKEVIVRLRIASMPNGTPLNLRRLSLQPFAKEHEPQIDKARQRLESLDAGEIVLGSTEAAIGGPLRPKDSFIGGFRSPDDHLKWSFTSPRSGKYSVIVTATRENRGEYQVTLGDLKLTGKIAETDPALIVDDDLGTIELVQGRTYEAVLQPTSMPDGSPLSVRRILLQPETAPVASTETKEILLPASEARTDSPYLAYVPDVDCIACWQNTRGRVTWSFAAPASGKFEVVVTNVHGNGPSKYVVQVGDQKLTASIAEEGGDPSWTDWIDDVAGTVDLTQGKTYRVSLQVVEMTQKGSPMNLRSITLRPAQ
jgi:hypothetical protein